MRSILLLTRTINTLERLLVVLKKGFLAVVDLNFPAGIGIIHSTYYCRVHNVLFYVRTRAQKNRLEKKNGWPPYKI